MDAPLHSRLSLKPLIYLLLSTYLVIVVYPMIWLLYTSLKTDQGIFLDPFGLPDLDRLQWANFSNAWTKGHFGDYFFNSVLMTVSTVTLTMLLAAMAAYALSRFSFPGVRPLFFYFLAGLMIPLQLAIVPLFFQLKEMALLNSRSGLLLVYVAFGMPFAIFILTGFFRSLPTSLHESALIDGAGEFRVFRSIMLPLARPGLITVASSPSWGRGTSSSWPSCSSPARARSRCAPCRWGWPTSPSSASSAATGAWPSPGWC